PVLDNGTTRNFAKFLKCLSQLVFGHLVLQVSDINVHLYLLTYSAYLLFDFQEWSIMLAKWPTKQKRGSSSQPRARSSASVLIKRGSAWKEACVVRQP